MRKTEITEAKTMLHKTDEQKIVQFSHLSADKISALRKYGCTDLVQISNTSIPENYPDLFLHEVEIEA